MIKTRTFSKRPPTWNFNAIQRQKDKFAFRLKYKLLFFIEHTGLTFVANMIRNALLATS